MEKAIRIIETAQSEGLFSAYAIGGGIAALFYMEPVATFDLDIFIIPPETAGPLVSLSPIYSWFEKRGYKPLKEQIVIEGIAVQFIPVYNDLVKEAVLNAQDKTYGTAGTRVMGPEYLVAIMVQTGRPKDKERIVKFLQQADLNVSLLDSILQKYGLSRAFEEYERGGYGRTG
ncbi:MAG: hypothetical protein JW768_05460 [Chitinispirillaceae bacterium]|nr:hypothetical protein [Chitinispirillaceae bacterium]